MDIEAGSDTEDIEEYLNVFYLNNQTKLYSSNPVSVRDECFIIIKLARRLILKTFACCSSFVLSRNRTQSTGENPRMNEKKKSMELHTSTNEYYEAKCKQHAIKNNTKYITSLLFYHS